MIDPLFYWCLLGLAALYIGFAGAAPERIGIGIVAVGSLFSFVVGTLEGLEFERFELGVFLIDLAVLAAFVALALFADRHWPLGVAGLQLVGLSSHAAELVSSQVIAWAYSIGQSLWAYPMIVLIVAGAVRHRRRLRALGTDRSWWTSSPPFRVTAPPGPTG